MGRFKIRPAVALATFIVGVVAASLWMNDVQDATEQSTPMATAGIRPTPNHPDGWKKIDVDGKFSVYLPIDMREEKDPIGNNEYLGPHKSFVSNTLGVGYVYIERQNNEELWRKPTCELLTSGPEGEPNFRSSEVEINGRSARQSFWQSDKSKSIVVSVCFPSVGEGMVLTLRGVPKDHRDYQALDAAKQIFSSIEFP
ncbi:MAG: hypothetical protein QOJ64_298 [Acidobacteriota bacterium]|jgi:hypothetical protein|nr:hypothetical protein [Acidobacteriota bacterium]